MRPPLKNRGGPKGRLQELCLHSAVGSPVLLACSKSPKKWEGCRHAQGGLHFRKTPSFESIVTVVRMLRCVGPSAIPPRLSQGSYTTGNGHNGICFREYISSANKCHI